MSALPWLFQVAAFDELSASARSKACKGLAVPLQTRKRASPVVPGAGMDRLDGERLVAVGERFLVALQTDEGIRAVAERIDAVGTARNGSVKRGQSVGVTLQFHQRVAAADQRFDKRRIDRERPVIRGKRLLGTLQRLEHAAAAEMGERILPVPARARDRNRPAPRYAVLGSASALPRFSNASG